MKRTILSAVLVMLSLSAVAHGQQPYDGGWRESSRPGASNPRYARVAAQPTARDTGATHAVYWQRVEEEPVYQQSGEPRAVNEYPAQESVREYSYSVPVTRREYTPAQSTQPFYGVNYRQPTYTRVSATSVEPDYGTTFVQQPSANCCCPTGGAVPVQSVRPYPLLQPFGGDGAQVRPGLLGQPSLYVPGQPLRNAFRFLAL